MDEACMSVVIIKGEHFQCELKAGHVGWLHLNGAAKTSWSHDSGLGVYSPEALAAYGIDVGVGTGVGEADDPAVSEATFGVTRSVDCPEAPTQAHPHNPCTGAASCTASPHWHGCLADSSGDCDDPTDHESDDRRETTYSWHGCWSRAVSPSPTRNRVITND